MIRKIAIDGIATFPARGDFKFLFTFGVCNPAQHSALK